MGLGVKIRLRMLTSSSALGAFFKNSVKLGVDGIAIEKNRIFWALIQEGLLGLRPSSVYMIPGGKTRFSSFAY